jgi:hypothetical protein
VPLPARPVRSTLPCCLVSTIGATLLPLLLTERRGEQSAAAAIYLSTCCFPCGWALLLLLPPLLLCLAPTSPTHYYHHLHCSILGRRLCLSIHRPPSTHRSPLFPPALSPAPTKSRARIPPPSHPASAQHASTRRNRPSILTLSLHPALLLGHLHHQPTLRP